jgi:kynurenine formamidase
VRPWKPPDYVVEEGGKVVGARAGSPNNWGRWGENDQRGTLNLLTEDRVAAAARLVRTGKRFALGLPIRTGQATPSRRPEPLHLFMATAGEGVLRTDALVMSDDLVIMGLQSTTQVDGLAHAGSHDVLYNGYWAGVVNSSQGARRLGLDHASEGFSGRGVLLDVASHLGVDALDGGFAIDAALLDATSAAQGVEIGTGDIVLVRTGFLNCFIEEGLPHGAGQPGLADDTVDWLYEHDVVMVGADNEAVQMVAPAGERTSMRFHVKAIRDLGLYLAEILDLDALATDCKTDGVYEGFFVASLLPVAYSVGSPINPIFFK